MVPAVVPFYMVALSLYAVNHAHVLGARKRLFKDPISDMYCNVMS